MNGLRKCDIFTNGVLAIKKNKIMLFTGKWMELENIMLSEISKAQKIKGHLVSLFCGSQTYKINAHINTYMILTTHTHTHTHTHTERT
jgi:hypothetical protein